MNPEIHSIIEDMKKHIPQNDLPQDDRGRQNTLSFQMAHLLVLLAEESERQSNKLSEETEELIRYTRTIRYLTWALFLLGGIQIVMFFIKP